MSNPKRPVRRPKVTTLRTDAIKLNHLCGLVESLRLQQLITANTVSNGVSAVKDLTASVSKLADELACITEAVEEMKEQLKINTARSMLRDPNTRPPHVTLPAPPDMGSISWPSDPQDYIPPFVAAFKGMP
jgi:hypothetical protein